MNWCFLSTSGVHGSYTTLDDLEFDEEYQKDCVDSEGNTTITAMVLHPRMCCILCGEMKINIHRDSEYLRKLVKSTVDEVTEFAAGNLPITKTKREGCP